MADEQSTNAINNDENGVQKIALITGITGQVKPNYQMKNGILFLIIFFFLCKYRMVHI